MKITVEETEHEEGKLKLTGKIRGEEAGYAVLYRYDGGIWGLSALWLTDKGRAWVTLGELADAVAAYMKGKGCTELFFQGEEPDEGDEIGFRLEERDNSGWYPKYYFLRKL